MARNCPRENILPPVLTSAPLLLKAVHRAAEHQGLSLSLYNLATFENATFLCLLFIGSLPPFSEQTFNLNI